MEGLEAVDAAEQLRAISAITDVEINRMDVDDLLVELLDRILELMRGNTAAVLLLDATSQRLVARAARGIEEEVRQGVGVAVGRGFAGRVAAERRPVTIDRVDSSTVDNPILWEKGIRAMLGVPLQSGDRLLGVLHVGSLVERVFDEDDVALLTLVADRVSGAIVSRELEVERTAARVLQRSLLPSALPECPGLEFATRYVPAEEGGVGGDWFDVFMLPAGEIWVMVGDVAGHGLSAAVVMGRLRATLRSYALEGHGPEEVLNLADRKIQYFEPERMATVLCAESPPPYDEMYVASAGHLQPVLAHPGEPAQLVELPVAVPLGVVDDLNARSAKVELRPGSLFLAYTDGLVERRGQSLDAALDRLAALVVAEAPEIACREVMRAFIGSDAPRDDVALLAMRRRYNL